MIQQIYLPQRQWWARLMLGISIGAVCAVVAATLLPNHQALAAPDPNKKQCGDVQTSLIRCDDIDKYSNVDAEKGGYIFDIIGMFIRILTAGVGIAAVGGIVYGAILYASAADNQAQVVKAIAIIRNVIIGLVAYALMYVLIEFLIPGGLFKR